MMLLLCLLLLSTSVQSAKDKDDRQTAMDLPSDGRNPSVLDSSFSNGEDLSARKMSGKITCSQKAAESIKPESGVSMTFYPQEEPIPEWGFVLASCPPGWSLMGPSVASCSEKGWTPKKLGYCFPVLTSCRRNIPMTPAVHGIKYKSEEPWIPSGGSASIFCLSECKAKISKVTATCLEGLWKYEPCKDCSVLLIGGTLSLSSLEYFNPWVPSKNRLLAIRLPTKRQTQISAVLNDRRVLIAGGDNERQFLSSVELLDPTEETFSQGPSMSTRRMAPGVAVVDGVVFVCGGNDGKQNLRTCERFQGGVWEAIAPMNTARHGLATVVLDRTLYAFGGHDGGPLTAVEAYNIEGDSWTTKTPLAVARWGLAAAVWEKTIIVCGGHNGDNLCDKYDVEVDKWASISSMNKKRAYLSLLAVGDWLVALGGYGGEDSAEIYDPVKDQWTLVSQKLAQKRFHHSGVVI